jgi:GH24 family phage-related lysozyme (muramidase)
MTQNILTNNKNQPKKEMNLKTILIHSALFIIYTLIGYCMFLNYKLEHMEKKIEYVPAPPPIGAPMEVINPLSELHSLPVPKPKKVSFNPEIPLAIDLIKKFEGLYLRAYPDPKTGNLPITIGYGSTVNKDGKPFKMGDTITKVEAENLLIEQINKDYLPTISKIPFWNSMSMGQRASLISFGYNIGKGFYGGENFQTISRHLKEKNWTAIPKTLTLYSNPKNKKVHKGLLTRRLLEGTIWAKSICKN